jgi:hypothetical protein
MTLTNRLFIIFGLVFMLSSCTASSLDIYANNQPVLDPTRFFNGPLVAQGVLKNRSGEVTRYFTATINAYWVDGIGTLEERFEFNDGEIQYRTWTLTPRDAGYAATAGDVLGIGIANTKGNAMKLEYVLQINYKGTPLALSVEDWMWLVDDNTLLNESILRKWGFRIGSVQLVISKESSTELQETMINH